MLDHYSFTGFSCEETCKMLQTYPWSLGVSFFKPKRQAGRKHTIEWVHRGQHWRGHHHPQAQVDGSWGLRLLPVDSWSSQQRPASLPQRSCGWSLKKEGGRGRGRGRGKGRRKRDIKEERLVQVEVFWVTGYPMLVITSSFQHHNYDTHHTSTLLACTSIWICNRNGGWLNVYIS